jgi:hypothetical protein
MAIVPNAAAVDAVGTPATPLTLNTLNVTGSDCVLPLVAKVRA